MSFQFSNVCFIRKTFPIFFRLSDSELKEYNIVRTLVTAKPDVSCRISFENAEIIEVVLSVNHQHLPKSSPFQASHAISIRENVKEAFTQENQISEVITDRIISLRAFSKQNMMICADLAKSPDIATKIFDIFNDKMANYIHLHFAKQGCYAAKVNSVYNKLRIDLIKLVLADVDGLARFQTLVFHRDKDIN